MKVNILILISLAYIQISRAQFDWPARSVLCSNPNENKGVCVSIYDCPSLMSIINRDFLRPTDIDFIRASKCTGVNGEGPHVCCTRDTDFTSFRGSSDWLSSKVNSNVAQIRQPGIVQPQLPIWSAKSRGRTPTISPYSYTVSPFQPKAVSSASLIPQSPVCGGIRITNKIIGGIDANLNEFPWMALLEYKRSNGQVTFECAGSLINNRYILTAAHCVKGQILIKKGPLTTVRLGEHDRSQRIDCNQNICARETITVGVEETIPHDLYKDASNSQLHDIALVRLNRDITFTDSIYPICLPSVVAGRRPTSGSDVTVAGWGSTATVPRTTILQKLKVKIADQRKCQRKFETINIGIESTQLCAGGLYGRDSCSGDSGGPLMHFRGVSWVLEGIVSFGYGCGLAGWPAVYTRVSEYNSWILSKIRA